MTYSIEQMKAQVSASGGFARPNMFSVQLPPILIGSTEPFNVICKAANLPGKQILTTPYQVGLGQSKMVNGYASEDVTLTFHVMNDFKIRSYFEAWQRAAVNEQSGELGYYRDYVKEVRLRVLKKGFSLPIYKNNLGLPNIPSTISNRLPSFGPFDLARNEVDITFVTPDQIAYEVRLIDAFPTSMTPISLSDNETDTTMEMSVQLSYRRWENVQPEEEENGLVGDLAAILTKIGIF